MAEHLSGEQMEQYRKKNLSPAELLEVDRHLGECAECREELLREELLKISPTKALESWQSNLDLETEHLSYEQISDFVDGRLSEIDREIVETHIETCPRCSGELNDLQLFAKQIASEQKITLSAWEKLTSILLQPRYGVPSAIAAALVLFILVGTPLFQKELGNVDMDKSAEEREIPGNLISGTGEKQAQKPRSEPRMTEESKGGASSVEPRSVPSGTLAKPASKPRMVEESKQRARSAEPRSSPPVFLERSKVSTALASKEIEVPASLFELARAGKSRGGRGAGASIASIVLLSPVGKVVEADQPTFIWKEVKGANNYIVSISDSRNVEILKSKSIPTTSWTATHSLSRDARYSWKVAAQKDNQNLTSVKAYIHVLSERKSSRIEGCTSKSTRCPSPIDQIVFEGGSFGRSQAGTRKTTGVKAQFP